MAGSYPAIGPFFSWMFHIAPYLEQGNVTRQANIKAWPWWQYQQGLPAIGENTLNGVQLPILSCPSDSRSNLVGYDGGMKFALTAYLGVNGICELQTGYNSASASGGYTLVNDGIQGQNGILHVNAKVLLGAVPDGTSNTLMVGERPPSNNLYYGWWFAGSGDQPYFGTTDVVLGVNEFNPLLGRRDIFREGNLNDPREEHRYHFWSLHPGGGNWLMADGSVQFITYSSATVLPALATRNGGEPVSIPN
jgi:prepilin-type processing-associated H-X9-DG protein